MHQSYTQLFHTTNCLDSKGICAFFQDQPSRTGNQSVQDVAVHAIACQRDGLVSGFRGNRNDIAGQNIAKYAMPYDIEFRDELPKTLVGKVAYRILEEEEADRQATQEAVQAAQDASENK